MERPYFYPTQHGGTMKIQSKQIEGMTFAALAESGHWTVMDSDAELGGRAGATKPLELVLMGLAGCTGMDVVSILKKMRVDYQNLTIDVEAERAGEHPKVFTAITVVYRFRGQNLDTAKLQRAVDLSAEKYCAVSAMLGKTAQITHRIEVEAD